MNQDIPIERLDAAAAGRLGAMFQAAAATARKGGCEAEEGFLIGLAGLMASIVDRRVSAGDPPPKMATVNSGTIITTDKLSAADTLRAAQFTLSSGERFRAEGHEAIGKFLTGIAEVLTNALREKVTKIGDTVP